MIRHQTIGEKIQRVPGSRLKQESFEGGVIVRTFKKRVPFRGSVEHVKHDSGKPHP